MPQVPELRSEQLQEQASPAPRLSPNVSIDAVGGGTSLQEGQSAIQGAQHQIRNLIFVEKQKANALAEQEAINKVTEIQSKILYDKDTGVYTRKGKDTLSIHEDMKSQYKKEVLDLINSLSNDDQKKAVSSAAKNMWGAMERQGMAHTVSEMDKFETNTKDSFVKNNRDLATEATTIKDPHMMYDEIDKSILKQQEAIAAYEKHRGSSADEIKEKLLDASSKTHMGVIDRMLANDQDQAASTYYKLNKEQVSGQDKINIERHLEEGSLRGDSQRAADAIYDKKLPMAQSLELARQIKDPKRRDETVRRVQQQFDAVEHAREYAEKQTYLNLAKQVAQNPGRHPRDVTDPAAFSSLEPKWQESLVSQSFNPVNDTNAEFEFFHLLNKDQLKNLDQADFMQKYYNKFDAHHKDEALKRYDLAKSGNPTDNLTLTSTLSFTQNFESAMRLAKLIPAGTKLADLKDEKKLMYLDLQNQAAKKLNDLEINNALMGRKFKATQEEQNKIYDDVLKSAYVNRSWFFDHGFLDSKKAVSTMKQDEKGNSYIPYDEIPKQLMNLMIQRAMENGKHPSHNEYEKAAGSIFTGLDERAESILGPDRRDER
jgi:hypothetical protein